jgi:polysaccharide biosynthesis transport protein
MPPPVSTASSTEEDSISTGRFKPLVSFLKYKWLALLIFVIVSALGVPVALKTGNPVYMAQAVVLVSPKFIPTLDSEKGMDLNRNNYILYLKQQANMLRRNDVLQETLQRAEVRKIFLLPEETDKQAQSRLKTALNVKSKRGNPFITVQLTGSSAKGLDIIVNNLVDVYLKKAQAEIFYDSDGRIEKLNQHKKELQAFISEKQKKRMTIAEELGVTTFQENSLNPYDDILIENTSAFTLARRQRVEAETRLSALKKQLLYGQTTLETLVSEMVANDRVLISYKTKLIERRTELLTQTLGLTSKHPSKRRAEREIAQIDKEIERATRQLYQEIRDRLLQKAQAEIYQTQRLEEALGNEIEEQRAKAIHYANLYNQALVLNKEIDRAYRQLNKINNRIDFLSIEANAPGFVRLNTSATPARYPIKGGRKKIVLIFFVAALGLGLAVPILIDMLDKRIRTPGEVHKILGFPPMAWILNRHNLATQQLATDYLRRMALALERDWHTHETTGFVLTSVKPGGGTTTLTLELASMLSELGVHTLVVELNAFQPDPRYGGTTSQGLTSLLNQENEGLISPEMLIVPATGDLPDRLPVGQTSKRHLATHGKLRTVLKRLNAHYDLILMDTPPLLLSADAELLGEIAGGVLLVIEAGVVMPGELKRSAQLLERLNPPVVGSVLNRVEVFRGGGYFAKLLEEYETGAKLKKGLLQRFFFKS